MRALLCVTATLSLFGPVGCSSSESGSDAGGECSSSKPCEEGCCLGGKCKEGNSVAACGVAGGSCDVCLPGQTCRDGKCTFESASCTLPDCDGCCKEGTCEPGTYEDACGEGGLPCKGCAIGQECRDQHCKPLEGLFSCGGTPCEGCCDSGNCLPGDTKQACGTGGGPCVPCADDCVAGQCSGATCGPGLCEGCCFNGGCLPGNMDQACGKGGEECGVCLTGTTCVANDCPTGGGTTPPTQCSAATCAGCCRSNSCLSGTVRQACGRNGQACDVCRQDEQCRFGNCN